MSGTLTRVLTAAVLIPAVVAIVWWGSTALVAACVALVTLLAILEFFALAAKVGLPGYRPWTCLGAIVLLLHQWGRAERFGSDIGMHPFKHLSEFANVFLPVELVLLVFVLGAAVIGFAGNRPLRELLPAVCVSAGALLFVALPLSFLVLLRTGGTLGPRLLLFVLILVWVGDSAAYFVGRAVGRHLLAPQLSPGKTWEGAVANLLGSLLVGLVAANYMNVSWPVLLGGAAAGNLAGQVGDLLESAYKRSAGVKDSGVLVPGHGGMLDRVDALILAAPAVWYYFTLPWMYWHLR